MSGIINVNEATGEIKTILYAQQPVQEREAPINRPYYEEKSRQLGELTRRLLGAYGNNIEFVPTLEQPLIDSEGMTIRGVTLGSIARVALSPSADYTTIHEAYHIAENIGLVDSRSTNFLNTQRSQLLNIIEKAKQKGHPTIRGSREFYSKQPNREVQAYAAEAYDYLTNMIQEMSGFNGGVRRILQRIQNFFDAIRNYLRGLGYRSYQDLYNKFLSGELHETADVVRDNTFLSETKVLLTPEQVSQFDSFLQDATNYAAVLADVPSLRRGQEDNTWYVHDIDADNLRSYFSNTLDNQLFKNEFQYAVNPVSQLPIRTALNEVITNTDKLITSPVPTKVGSESFVNELGRISRWVLHPTQIARLVPPFRPFMSQVENRRQTRNVMLETMLRYFRGFFELSDTEKTIFQRFADIADNLAVEPIRQPDGTISFTVTKAVPEYQVAAYEAVSLNKKLSKAYMDMRKGLNYGYDQYINGLKVEAGLEATDTYEDILEKAALAPAIEPDPVKAEKDQTKYTNLAKLVQHAETQKRQGYIPRIRFGRYLVIARNKNTQQIEVVESPRENLFINSLEFKYDWTKVGRKRAIKAANEMKTKIQQRMGKNYEVTIVEKKQSTYEEANLRNFFSTLGTFQTLLGMGENESVDTFIAGVIDQLGEKSFEQFLRQRSPKNIRGHINEENVNNGDYLLIALDTYARRAAHYSAHLQTRKGLEAAETELAEGLNNAENISEDVRSRVKKVAKEFNEYIVSPKEEGGFFRMLGFNLTIGGNISSSLGNLTQTTITTLPLLSSVIEGQGPLAASRETLKAGRVAFKLGKLYRGNLETYGFIFEGENPLPNDITNEEWAMLKSLYQKGVIQALQNLDLGARWAQTYGKPGGKLAKMQELWGYPFGFIENVNRVTAALAFHRAFKSNAETRKNIVAIAQDSMFENMNMTPEVAAEFGVTTTQFIMGKENTPQFTRGTVQRIVTQFWSFVLQMIELQFWAFKMGYKNKTITDPITGETISNARLNKIGKQFLNRMVLGTFLWAGLMGLPPMEDLKVLLKQLSKLFGHEIDVEYTMRQWIGQVAGAETAKAITRGPLSSLLGVAMSRRIGLSEPIPVGLMYGDLTAFFGPTVGHAFNLLQRGTEALNKGEYLEAGTLMFPLAIRNVMEAMNLEEKGFVSSRGKGIVPPSAWGKEGRPQLTTFDKVAKAIGFSSSTLQDARSEISARQHLKFKGRGAKEAKTQEFVKMKLEAIAAARAGDQARARRLHQEFYREWMAHKKEDRTEDPEDRLNIRMQTITQRVRVQQDPLGRAAERYIPRHLRKGLRDRTLLAGYPSS